MGSILSIQYLRGVAALMVVLYHVIPQIQRMGYTGREFDQLAAGVDVFFVISGFIMWFTTQRSRYSPAEFYQHRVIRIVPLYWIITAGIVALMLVAPKLLQTTTLDWYHVGSSFFFVPHRHPVLGGYIPVLNPGWTLNYEMFFYVLFGLALLVRNASARLTSIVGVLAALAAAPALVPLTGAAAFYTNSIVLEFAAGILLAASFARFNFRRSWLWLLLIMGGFAWIAVAPDGPRAWRYGIGALLVVTGALGLPEFKMRPLRGLGDSSYSLYLSHFVVMSAAGQFWRKAGLGGMPFPLFAAFGVAMSVAVGWATYRLIEVPLTNWARCAWPRKMPHPAASSVTMRCQPEPRSPSV